jgi:Na+/proline symporter
MPKIEDLIPAPPRPANAAWSNRVNARMVKTLSWVVVLSVISAALILLQFVVEEAPIYSRIALGIFAFPPIMVAVLLWKTATKEARELLAAWESWPLSGMKPEKGGLPKPADPSAVDLRGILAGRVTDEYFVFIDPKYRFNRKRLDTEFLQELSKEHPER